LRFRRQAPLHRLRWEELVRCSCFRGEAFLVSVRLSVAVVFTSSCVRLVALLFVVRLGRGPVLEQLRLGKRSLWVPVVQLCCRCLFQGAPVAFQPSRERVFW
jgi:hypothetical protein